MSYIVGGVEVGQLRTATTGVSVATTPLTDAQTAQGAPQGTSQDTVFIPGAPLTMMRSGDLHMAARDPNAFGSGGGAPAEQFDPGRQQGTPPQPAQWAAQGGPGNPLQYPYSRPEPWLPQWVLPVGIGLGAILVYKFVL